MAVQDEQLSSWVVHGVLAEVVDEEGDVGWLSVPVDGWYGESVAFLVGEKHLESSAEMGVLVEISVRLSP